MRSHHVHFARFPIRIMLGIIFLAHGLKKLKGIEQTVARFHADLGLPATMTYLVTFIEVAAGALLILGLFTRIASAGAAAVMAGAIFTVTWHKGFMGGYEFNLALLAMALSLLFSRAK